MKRTIAVGVSLLVGLGWGVKSADWVEAAPVIDAPVSQPAKDGATQIELLDAGTIPRQPLRYQAAANTKRTVILTLDQNLTATVDGKPFPTLNLPQVIVTIETVVTQVDPNGDIHYKLLCTNVYAVLESSAPSGLAREVQADFHKLKGIKGSLVFDSRGQSKRSSYSLPNNADAPFKWILNRFSQSMRQFNLLISLPETAVGVGARWRIARLITVNDINLTQSDTYELVSLKDSVATLKVRAQRQAAPQPLKLSFPGRLATLETLTGQSNGQIVVNLGTAFIDRASIADRSHNRVLMSDPKTTQTVEINTRDSTQIQWKLK